MRKHWSDRLPLSACEAAVEWAKRQPSLAVAWERCGRGDWMLWLLARHSAERGLLVIAAADCAALALPFARGDSALAAIENAVAWAEGQVGIETVGDAADAAFADAAASYAAFADAAAAYAAASAFAGAGAATAAAYAAYAAADDAAVLAQCAAIVRYWFPLPPKL